LSSVISLLTPTAARTHFGLLLFLRVLSGLGEGVLFPALHSLIARWSAPRHRSVIVSVILFGTDAGIVVGMPVAGALTDHGFAGGWPSVFYVFGIVGCIWTVAWCLLCYNSPSTHPRISSVELAYWRSVLGTTYLVSRPRTPWRAVFTSVPVWALAVAFFANNWGFFTLATCIPLFMYDVLGFDMTKNGALSAVPFVSGILVLPFGLLADWLRTPGRLTTNAVRKIFCACGFISTGCMLIAVAYSGCDRALVVILMFIAVGCTCLSYPVVTVNQLDLAPLHAGRIMGLTHFFGSLAAVGGPHAVGALTYHRSSRSEWQKVFFLAAGLFAVGAVMFVVFGSGERQRWAERDEHCRQVDPQCSQLEETVNRQPSAADELQLDSTL